MRSRASWANLTSFAAIVATPLACRLGGFLLAGSSAFKDAEDVAFLHDQELFAVDLDFGARPFAEEDAITSLNVERLNHSFFVSRSWSGSDHLALLGLFLRGIGNDDAAGSPLVLLDTTHHHPVVQWTKLHSEPPPKTWSPGERKPPPELPGGFSAQAVSTFKIGVLTSFLVGKSLIVGGNYLDETRSLAPDLGV